ncbi:flagellar hook-basal body complex protein FliE [Silanimonas lenta]|uniref:flagellar hook-basal body complex protein FliE n=1 Tax=Silanimonas lenta TaxID=265429 RepID=UPI0003FC7DF6|nr:flagellar hook-basal body complex protein FliE [Silanimonas lenta]
MTDAISSVLSQIRSYQAQMASLQGAAGAAGPAAPGAAPAATGLGASPAVAAPSFGEALGNAIRKVNTLQAQTRELQAAFERGDPRADLARVMVAAQASSVAFRATVEVRNRLVQAYQDVMNMPL